MKKNRFTKLPKLLMNVILLLTVLLLFPGSNAFASANLDLADGSIVIKNGAYSIGGGADVPNADNTYTISQTDYSSTATVNTITVQDDVAATVTLNGVNISGGTPIDLSSRGNLSLSLADGITNTLQGADGKAGIRVIPGAALTINGPGTISINAGNWGAGIGGNKFEHGGTVTINGGTVNSYGSGAGIGAGISRYLSDYENGRNGGNVTINGGTVYASGETGIGGTSTYKGTSGSGGSLTVTGGSVTATGCRGIGSGYKAHSVGSYGTPVVLKIDQGAILKAYSSGYSTFIMAASDDSAVESSAVERTAATIFQGTFATAPNGFADTNIDVYDDASPATIYNLTLQANYESFATIVSGGGVYTAKVPNSPKVVAQSDNNTNFSITAAQLNSFSSLKLIEPPVLVSAARTDDTHITVTLSKDCTDITKANDGGFTVTETGTPAVTYAVAAIAQGADASQVVLSVADMGISAKEGVTVTYTTGGNGTVQDTFGTPMLTDNTGAAAAPWDTALPEIESGTLSADNTYIDIDFSEGAYGAADGITALTSDKLVLVFSQNGGTAANAAISSVKCNDNADEGSASALTGGETTVRVFLNVTGTPYGLETIEIKPANGTAIYDEAGNAMSALQTTGAEALNGLPPSLQSAVRTDDTHITVTLSKDCSDITKNNDGGFTVTETETPAVTYAVSAIAQGADASHVVLTVADMGISAKEGVTVTYTAGGNGTVQDTLGSPMATDNTGAAAAPWDTASPEIDSGTLSADNTYIDIVFSEGVYGAADGITALTSDKLVLIFSQNGGSAANAAISSVKCNDNSDEGSASALTGGEMTVRVFLNVTGIPCGLETIEIKPASGTAIYDEAGNAMSALQTTGIMILAQTAPVASAVNITGTEIIGQTLIGHYTYNGANGDLEGISTFKWYRADNQAGLNKTEIVGAAGITYTLQIEDMGKYISIEVTPVAQTGTSGIPVESARTGAINIAVPGAPVIQSLVLGDGHFTISWNSVSGSTEYKIFMSTTSGLYGSALATVSSSIYSYDATGLTNGITYYFVVRATNLSGDSGYSNEVSAMPKTVPDAPTSITAAPGNAQATVSFTAPSDNGGSQITGYIVTSNPGNITATGAGTTITVTGLTPGTTYTFSVKAINIVGNSPESAASNSVIPYSSGSSENNAPLSPTKSQAETAVSIIVNGKAETAAAATTTKIDDKTVTTVIVDDKKVEEIIQQETNNAVFSISIPGNADVVIGALNGKTVKNMENKAAVVEIKTDNVIYTLPASQIDIDAVSNQLGNEVQPKDIAVNIKISRSPKDTIKVVEENAAKNNYQVLVKPIDFEITCTTGNTKMDVSKFNSFVERVVAIPQGVEPSKVTTGIVLNQDGTFSHVPTTTITINGKHYAKISSLTNSTYSVIYSSKTFKDVEKHWAKKDVNDMGLRLVFDGVGDGMFKPDKEITRAEFAAIVVRALGLMRPGTGKDVFIDVTQDAWYYDSVFIAYENGIISGYEAGNFGPMDKITRDQATAILAKAMNITRLRTEITDEEVKNILALFGDSGQCAEWARESIATCINTGILSGKVDKTIAPKDKMTRAEAAVFVRRLLQKSKLIN